MDPNAGKIVGKPTLLVTFTDRLDARRILDAVGALNYPLNDVSVYYRVVGTDQVIDALTGQVAAGQALSEEDTEGLDLNKVDTLVLMHPSGEQFVAVQGALNQFGEADYKYADAAVSGTENNAGANNNGEVVTEAPRVELAEDGEVPRGQ
ncbi:MAG TPA: hypothetical protein VFR15_15360 [Chloroflexia bacterium]|nr:hypothetical protein [Chloroflexia bacterium]